MISLLASMYFALWTVVMLPYSPSMTFSAAFDTVYYTILLNHLSKMLGIAGHALLWFQSF